MFRAIVTLLVFSPLVAVPLSTQAQAPAPSDGPDVIVGFVNGTIAVNAEGERVGVAAATNSCNKGNASLNWVALPDGRHPVIVVNIYRLLNDRFEQLGQSWVKHGFYATNQTDCFGVPDFPQIACAVGGDPRQLKPGCSDLYGAGLNADPGFLGPRSKINPTTGAFINPSTGQPDRANAQNLSGYPTSTPLQRIAYVKEADLFADDARYFVEGQYIAADDAAAGNARNNISYREITPLRTGGGIAYQENPSQIREQPALKAWEGATFFEKTGPEAAGGQKGTILVASKAVKLPGNSYRYEYAVHNMNSDLAVQSLRVPIGTAQISDVGFSAVPSFGELWSNDAWSSAVEGGKVVWASKTYQDDPKANALRWGTIYNFWFTADAEPSDQKAVVGRFKLKEGSQTPEAFDADIVAPGGS
jgi:hypothetical protein